MKFLRFLKGKMGKNSKWPFRDDLARIACQQW
jgi:hypothetical protein